MSGPIRGALRAVGRAGGRILDGVDQLGRPASRTALGRMLSSSVLVLASLMSIVATLAVGVGVIAFVASEAGASATVSAASAAQSGRTVTETMDIQTGKMDGKPGWPRFTNASWTVHQGDTVIVRIVNYDDGTAPLAGVQADLASVQGTTTGSELIDGKQVQALQPQDISHTFTVPGLGLNLPIPAAPTGGSVTVEARFVAGASGTFTWQCYAPCGSGANAMGGAMSTMNWMEGKVRVTP